MTLTARLVAAAIALAVVAAGGALLLRPSTPNVLSTPSPSPSSARPSPLAPNAVIDVAGLVQAPASIPITANGEDIWIGVDGAVIHVDGRTLARTQFAVPAMSGDNATLFAASDGLWVGDYRGRRIQRLDPATGAVELEANAPSPIAFHLIGKDLWVGTDLDAGLHRVDRTTGELGPRIGTRQFATAGLGQFWAGNGNQYTGTTITRIDPATGEVVSSVAVPKGLGCGVSGSFPDNIWAGCPHVADAATPSTTSAARIDPATNALVTTVAVPGAYGGVIAVVDRVPWMVAGRMDGDLPGYALVAVDPASGRILKSVEFGRIEPIAVVTPSAFWIADERGRVLRYDLSALHP